MGSQPLSQTIPIYLSCSICFHDKQNNFVHHSYCLLSTRGYSGFLIANKTVRPRNLFAGLFFSTLSASWWNVWRRRYLLHHYYYSVNTCEAQLSAPADELVTLGRRSAWRFQRSRRSSGQTWRESTWFPFTRESREHNKPRGISLALLLFICAWPPSNRRLGMSLFQTNVTRATF